jgi:hypothetical protein
MEKLQQAIRRDDFEAAARHAREGVSQLPAFVLEWVQDYGRFDIASIPCIEAGGRMFALTEHDEDLETLTRAVDRVAELHPWREQVESARQDRALVPRILATVTETPGVLQKDLKALLGETDGRRVAVLIGYLERAGRLGRAKAGPTYALYPPGSAEIPRRAEPGPAGSHRRGASPPPTNIDFSQIAYVPLPRAPLRWEETQAGRERIEPVAAAGTFEVRDAAWRLSAGEKIPSDERPDPAFRQTYPCAEGAFLIDDLGKSDGLGPIGSAAIACDPQGRVRAKAGFARDIYRIGVHPRGSALIALSRDGVLHAHDGRLQSLFETNLAEAPEVVAMRKRFEVSDEELKSHIRCVALSADAQRYLFTTVDEAWCISVAGTALWGVKLPIKDDWSPMAAGDARGTSAQVQAALDLIGLALPFAPQALKDRYRQLAKAWHPDLNPGDPLSAEKMKALNAALEVLTGLDAEALPTFVGGGFYQEIGRQEISVGGATVTLSMGYQVSERFAADWIYAAAFAAEDGGAYLAGYSGRVLRVDAAGRPLRAYDIGAVPRRILDLGRYLYLLTDTRLYVLHGETLHAVVDVFDGGDLLAFDRGFAVLEKKRLRWFSPDGTYLGAILSKDPIRRIAWAGTDMILETRQTRVRVEGLAAA